jgi:hypothetical protein
MRGRKPKRESRSAEFRRRLMAWQETPESSRPSLRSLASDLDTSHQLLGHYLKGLEKWRHKECYGEAKKKLEQIRARAIAEGRPMAQWEEEQVHAHTREAARALVAPMLLDMLEGIKREAKSGPLDWCQIKTLKRFARTGIPGAQELLQKCLQSGLKKRKRFAEIVKETPRQEGETYIAWVRRIWDQCDNYDTNCPAVITEELLQKCSQSSANNRKDNLPAISVRAAKSLRTVREKAEEDWQLR